MDYQNNRAKCIFERKCADCNTYILEEKLYWGFGKRFGVHPEILFVRKAEANETQCINCERKASILKNKKCKTCTRYFLSSVQRTWNLYSIFQKDCFNLV